MISYLQFEIIVMINQFSERRKQNESSNFLKTTLILVIQTHKNGNEAFKQSWHEGTLYTVIFLLYLTENPQLSIAKKTKRRLNSNKLSIRSHEESHFFSFWKPETTRTEATHYMDIIVPIVLKMTNSQAVQHVS